jgi:hypothetical protein
VPATHSLGGDGSELSGNSAAPLTPARQNAEVGRRERLIEQLQPLLEPGERISHLFVANHGVARASRVAMMAIAVTDRNIVSIPVKHMWRWKLSGTQVTRWPRVAFDDVPDALVGFDRWSWNGLDLWLDRPGRNEVKDANTALAGAPAG